ncbi:ketoacyl reductase : Ketoacyl reductase OS=Cystobacter violaceus Cb vi76 GN=Q664_51510 PE=4 SV=1: adh_short [Gemmataceae bacterium]|nr:ketoacyl reductase : Ketoacyl reductase OS=Cystobacter violaceus Cb vi76 GN=Q664_51510 PE=4 SV=1: adh_short [Gemmataceae bacterium]VTU00445.1 ketoacyl reductase : Ketoacyl reductase OS=Cystobacter violaceus Cb vi76 GN=Q664_51510 PE=4 SV=1: adh_short [Gemmataceae bacterium]
MNRALLAAAVGVGGYLAYRVLRPRYDFRNKHVLITGGSRGLGLVIARQLAARGARLSICSRDGSELVRAVGDLTRRGANVVAVECDVTDRDRVREMIAIARQKNGPIDVLVNNAGMIRVGPVEEMREEDFEASLRTHFWAALYTTLEVVPDMKARGAGRIVNVASIGGKIAVPHLLPYTAGKFALVGLSHGMRVELARYGIVVTTVCPGLMRTGSHLNAEFKGQHEKEYAWFSLGNATPGFSMSAETAAAKVLDACAVGDAEAVLGLPAKLGVAAMAACPNLTDSLLALADRWVLPERGGIGTGVAKGHESRGALPPVVTTFTDRAAARNNELHAADVPPPLPTGAR